MKLHELKIKDEYFNAIIESKKTFELRKNDKDYQVGDLIHFVEVYRDIAYIGGIPAFDIVRQKTATKEYTREFKGYEKNLFEITYILKDVPEYGLDKDYCILGIKKIGD